MKKLYFSGIFLLLGIIFSGSALSQTTYSLIGNAFYKADGISQANWDYDIDFAFVGTVGDEDIYKISRQEILKNGQFKVRVNHAWAVSYGFADITILGDPSNFISIPPNIAALQRKIYDISFIVNKITNTFTLNFEFSKPIESNVFITKTVTPPTIDGSIDALWTSVPKNNLDIPYLSQHPSLGPTGTSYWQALWNDNGIFVIIVINDDVFYPYYAVVPPGNSWEYDKPEFYFDVNPVLKDGLGPSTAPNGHILVAPDFIESQINGTTVNEPDGGKHAFKVSNPAYVAEYFVPFARLLDKNNNIVNKTQKIGFDVTVSDRDAETPFRQRAVWTNYGLHAESWVNMDDCGTITLVGDGANVLVSGISVAGTGGQTSITSEAGSLQMIATVSPGTATNKSVTWSVENFSGKASISASGLLTAIDNGTVMVKATSNDGTNITGSKTITISNQYISFADGSVLKDGGFETNGPIGGAWTFFTDNGATASVINGVCTIVPAVIDEMYKAMVAQTDWVVYNDTSYTLTFTAWSDVNRTIFIDMEDGANYWVRFGKSTDSLTTYGRSEWEIPLTTSPQNFTLHVTPDQVYLNTDFLFNIMVSNALGKVYIDNIALVSEGYKKYGNGPPVNGNATAVSPVCSGTSAVLHITGQSGFVKWQKSTDGVTGWTNISAGNGEDPADFTTPALSESTYFRAVISNMDFPELYSNVLHVIVNPLPADAGTIAGSAKVCSGQDKTLAYNVASIANASSYIWTFPTGVTALTPTSSRTVTLKYGSSAVSGNITVKGHNSCGDGKESTLPVTMSQTWDGQEICLVTIDENTGKNMIVWENTPNKGIASYNVYRESQVANKWDLIGNVPANNMSLFVDLESVPEQQQYIYAISIIDTCGNESPRSPWHKTMLLHWVSSTNGVNLEWADYQTENGSLSFESYAIWRGTDSTKLTELTRLNSKLFAYTDVSAEAKSQRMFYRVSGVKPVGCLASDGQGKKANSGPYVHSLSNLEDNRLVNSVRNLGFEGINVDIYPNLFSDYALLSYSLQKPTDFSVDIFNVVGEKVKTLFNEKQMPGNYSLRISAADLNYINGLYYVRIKANGAVHLEKIMLSK
ncbi:MAG: Ig-like domain-containing protein [Bacteroidales bacterium]|nr:Ig-like domain-containing protein [Bacteroidales bacterium]MCB9013955.1 Ig-like domain-containing protein [Bacteroidales bacterium]